MNAYRKIVQMIVLALMASSLVMASAKAATAEIVNTTFTIICGGLGSGHVVINPLVQTVVIDSQEVAVVYIVKYPRPDGYYYYETSADSDGKLVTAARDDIFMPYDDTGLFTLNIAGPLDVVEVQAFASDPNTTPLSDVEVFDRDPLCGSRGGTEPPVYDAIVMAGRADGLVNSFRLSNPNTYSVRAECDGGVSATLTAGEVQTFPTTVEYLDCTYYNGANVTLGTDTVRTLQFRPGAEVQYNCTGKKKFAVISAINTASSIPVWFDADRARAEIVAAGTTSTLQTMSLPQPGRTLTITVKDPSGAKVILKQEVVPSTC